MSAPEFRPGDHVIVTRVSHLSTRKNLTWTALTWTVSHATDEAVWCTAFDLADIVTYTDVFSPDALALVSRPVYPEPGQVAVLLDERDLNELAVRGGDSETPPLVRALCRKLIDRAREASR